MKISLAYAAPEVVWFRNYLRDKDVDVYQFGRTLEYWLEDQGIEPPEDQEWYDLPQWLQEVHPKLFEEFERHVKDEIESGENLFSENGILQMDWPTWAHMELAQGKPLRRSTWLVHFSKDADDIAYNGFKFGVPEYEMARMGLTTHFTDENRMRESGYNFAFEADSPWARVAWAQKKYGEHCVLFQASGVKASHWGDEEDQVIFWGPSVKPKNIIYVHRLYGEACVIAKTQKGKRRQWRGTNRDCVYQADYDQVVEWVQANHRQYAKVIMG